VDSSGGSGISGTPCDSGIALDASDPVHAAHAIGVCQGLVQAEWLYPDGSQPAAGSTFDIGHGVMAQFGANLAREGERLLALSSGDARTPNLPGYMDDLAKGYAVGVPGGFPSGESGCPAPSGNAFDGIALRAVLQVPAGATGLAFDYAYFTRDYPTWVCTQYVDNAAALVTGVTGLAADTNVLVDSSGNKIGATSTAMQYCVSNNAYPCALGTSVLAQTGFENGGSTGWLSTPVLPVTAGATVEIKFMIWDSADQQSKSTLLVDRFRWVTGP
jgi:hypothetical protein